jgi:PAS domain S-box-containing protein
MLYALVIPRNELTQPFTTNICPCLFADAHVKQYRAANQSVPQSIALLVADVRRKEDKRHAKRLANRKSACTSRARKKALIDEMTRENARLRRQALILSYLPDPVVAIRADGVITFCSMQVERVLRYNASELLGANIEDIIVPSSRESIRRLISDLVVAEQRALLSASSMEEEEEEEIEDDDGEDMGNENISASTTAARPHEVSEHSSEKSSLPPLLEVKVTSESSNVAAGEDVSDSSGDDKKNKAGHQQQQQTNSKTSDTSSLTHKVSSLSEGAGLGSGEDQTNNVANAMSSSSEVSSPLEKMITKEEKNSTEDESTSSENKANANLTKNVEMCKLNKDKGVDEQVRFSHKDDVMGASVTANNADAKLSSLMHHPKKEEVSGAALDVDGGIKLMSSGKQPEEEDQDEQVASMRQKCALLGLEGSSSKQDGTSSLSAGSSSLSKKKKQRGGNSSEDSGYRESNESPEESNDYLEDSLSSSEASVDRSSSKKKRKC